MNISNKDLVYKLNKAANIINKKSRKGASDFIITSSAFYDYFNRKDIRKDKIKKIFSE
jgi:chromosome segregation and condensation protein ScpB